MCLEMIYYILLVIVYSGFGNACFSRNYNHGSVVCVCNSTHCDTIQEPMKLIPEKEFYVYISDKNGRRFEKQQGNFKTSSHSNDTLILSVDSSKTFQSLLGFGGAFTDAAGINIASLSIKTQENLLKSYYATDGIEYTVGRVPIASCDFSTREYSYDDFEGDFDLSKFSLAPEDLKYKIPYIRKAKSISKRKISLFASPWSAPAWMKTNKKMHGMGTLIGDSSGKYFKAWANYFVKFLDEYKKHNISFWGLTAQNEPTDGYLYNFPFQCMGWKAESQRDFVAYNLGLALEDGGYGNLKLMILDDNRLALPSWAETVFSNTNNTKYVSGIAVHWYLDFIVPPLPLQNTHKLFPEKFILATEACTGDLPWDKGHHVILGSWERGQHYAHSIIQDLNNWSIGWTDWNIALDSQGGPNWVKNFVDSPIIVNATADEFYKQPMFYALGHFSKFLPEGSVRISIEPNQSSQLEFTAFLTPNQAVVITILNRSDKNIPFHIHVTDDENDLIESESGARSIATFIWWKE